MNLRLVPLDVTAGIESAKNQVVNFSKPAVNNVLVPIIAIVVGIFLLFFIGSAVKRHKGGDDYSDRIIEIIVCLVVEVLVLSFATWGWTIIGQ